ncbi:alpha/beta fold hydrolase [Paractinoplanes durhamensis]|uniref:alpha/beta fold hydrolase n=1 Tax=Paractinoplanes durhamensis TaxID=113563 RepID=UPI001941C41D|nr:alpha/beta hydrolase [Actinoplanes durhamensis]
MRAQTAAVERVVTLPDGRRIAVREGGDLDGVPVLFQHGTPGSRHQAGLVEAAARRCGVRLISANRPGYGTTPDTAPSLTSVGADAMLIADEVGVTRFGVAGVSGGGPYALATALAGPHRVSRVAVVAGIGPWRGLRPAVPGDPERDLLDLADQGRVEAALTGFRALFTTDHRGLLDIEDDEALVDAYLDGAPAADLGWLDREKKLSWAADLREALTRPDGYARDNVAWGGDWDIDVTAVTCPVRLYYGGDDRLVPAAHGHWLADRLPLATMVLYPAAGHGTTSFAYWDEVLRAVTE